MSRAIIQVANYKADGWRVNIRLPLDFLEQVDVISKQQVAGLTLNLNWGIPATFGDRQVSQAFSTQALADAAADQAHADIQAVLARRASVIARQIVIDL